jgi:hypothetical protein
MTAGAGLSDAQLHVFQTEGYVICKQLLPADLISSWRAQFWEFLEAEPDDPSRWPESAGHHETDIYTPEAKQRLIYPWAEQHAAGDAAAVAGPAVDLYPVSPSADQVPQLHAVVDQLLGPGRWCPGQRPGKEELDTVIFRWPRAASTPAPASGLPSSGHVEGGNSAKGGWKGLFALGAIAYWNNVGPGDGGTVIWPRSHLAVHKYLCEHPDRLAAANGVAEAGMGGRPGVELTMGAGDVRLTD